MHKFLKISLSFMFLNQFYFCFKPTAKINTIFYYEKSVWIDFVDRIYSNFLGTMPTLGFRILIVENGGSQSFITSDCRKYENLRDSWDFINTPCTPSYIKSIFKNITTSLLTIDILTGGYFSYYKIQMQKIKEYFYVYFKLYFILKTICRK